MRKNLFIVLGVLALVLVLSAPSQAAVTLSDTVNFYRYWTYPFGRMIDWGGGWINGISLSPDIDYDFVEWDFVFDSITEPIGSVTEASLGFYLRDDAWDGPWDGTEQFLLEMEHGEEWESDEDFNTGYFEYSLEELDDFKEALDDGRFRAVISNDPDDEGDFYLRWATLSFTYEPAGATVPEPASMALLGFGLLGAIGTGFRRKK